MNSLDANNSSDNSSPCWLLPASVSPPSSSPMPMPAASASFDQGDACCSGGSSYGEGEGGGAACSFWQDLIFDAPMFHEIA